MAWADKREYQKQWREKNKEKIKLQVKEWRSKNKDQVKEYARSWRKQNKDLVYEYNERFKDKNPEYFKLYQKQDKAKKYRLKWKQDNKEKLYLSEKKYRINKEREEHMSMVKKLERAKQEGIKEGTAIGYQMGYKQGVKEARYVIESMSQESIDMYNELIDVLEESIRKTYGIGKTLADRLLEELNETIKSRLERVGREHEMAKK